MSSPPCAVDRPEREVLVEAGVRVAGVVAARPPVVLAREARLLAAVGAEDVEDVGLAVGVEIAGGAGDDLQPAVAVDVAGGDAAHLVAPGDREAGHRRQRRRRASRAGRGRRRRSPAWRRPRSCRPAATPRSGCRSSSRAPRHGAVGASRPRPPRRAPRRSRSLPSPSRSATAGEPSQPSSPPLSSASIIIGAAVCACPAPATRRAGGGRQDDRPRAAAATLPAAPPDPNTRPPPRSIRSPRLSLREAGRGSGVRGPRRGVAGSGDRHLEGDAVVRLRGSGDGAHERIRIAQVAPARGLRGRRRAALGGRRVADHHLAGGQIARAGDLDRVADDLRRR